VHISGNLARDPELRYSKAGSPFTSFVVAVSKGTDKGASFVDCVTFGDNAIALAETAKKGTKVEVAGRIDQSSWETSDGQKRSKLQVIAGAVTVTTFGRKPETNDAETKKEPESADIPF